MEKSDQKLFTVLVCGRRRKARTYPLGRSPEKRGALFITALLASLFASSEPTSAQVSADFSDGAVRLGVSTSTCDGDLEGAVRYNGDDGTVELCDGDEWTPLDGGSGGSSINCASQGNNVAESATVTVESGQSPTYGSSLSNLVIGDTYSDHIAWGAGATTGTTLRIDLGSFQPVCQMRMLSYEQSGFETIKDFRLYGGMTSNFVSSTILLDATHANGVSIFQNYQIANPDVYRYYWLRIDNWYPGNGNNDPHIHKIELIPPT